MKIKFSWIPFIPVAVLSIILRLYQKLFVDSGIDTGFLSSDMIWLVYAGMVGLLFVVLLLLSAIDRKTSAHYTIKKNFFAGLFAVVAAALIIFDAGMNAGQMLSDGLQSLSQLIDVLFSILGGVAILVMGTSSFSGRNFAKKMGIFSVVAPIWCCIQLVLKFIEYTKQSVNAFDMTNLFFMAFMTLTIFNLSMAYQKVDCKNPVKGTVVYGMPAFIVTIVYAVANLIDQLKINSTYDFMNSLDILAFVALALYTLFMMIEFTNNAKNNTEYKPIQEIQEAVEQPTLRIKNEVEEEKNKLENDHIEITDVEENVNKELGDVDNVIEAMEKEDKNPEKYDPLSQEYFDSHQTDISEDSEISLSLKNIDRLINEINSEE